MENTSDAISRQAAIDAFHTWFKDGFDEDKWWNSTHVLAAIEGLPPVQQEHKWETCFDCPLSHGCPKIKGCTNEQAMEYSSQIPNDCPLSAQPEIIRCRNCKFASGDSRICMKFGHSPIGELDFCSFAERREVTT